MKKRLTKSSNNIVLTGTLGGIAEWIGIDPTIVRVIYVILALFSAGFPGFLLYIALVLLIPSGKRGHQRSYPYNEGHANPYGQQKKRKQAEKVDDDDWSDF